MSADFNSIANYWKETYSKNSEETKKYEHSAQFKKMADLMAPGKSYYYIANFQSLEIEMISDSVCNFIEKNRITDTEVDFQEILALALPEEIEKIKRKEQVIKDFFVDYLPINKVQDYKVLYTYVIKDSKGKRRVMLHQATTLSQDKEGRFVHVFSIHTDISHLTNQSVEEVSFLNIRGGKSYLNVPTKNGSFDPENHSDEGNIKNQLSKRELEITKLIAEGLNAEEIGEQLFISSHTVRTHRKNILKKTDSKNTIQLVARTIAAGLIQPDL
ncbi:response regulator transcription factor [Salegentibacter mishustinae]|uniref:HTH luxR-type domain-containing protein n=1 Tax=Salegentibacter mishustinae TaxID=270918 RepID=A0A0Q9ZBB2_9FLAO|nr:helix-turn-helix transcriptional regulator [Salegentibacter mishustinae]KRG30325.1 hypothetical protein APR42_00240 [Salegentibacter mishustinae]PNW23221.1 hypothetical protein APB85_00235 [Salegentibacter mishustinae]PZX66280.1 regulatory LuxR family protein [Salegentibacter mishustinae]GGW81554.1 hypothetical protein GCM10008086_06440 [Salegentibacter mishustinae]